MSFVWKVYADWDNDGDFDETFEDISADWIAMNWQLGMRQAFQHVADENTAMLTVQNADGKYNPENSSGTLYGYLKPNRLIQIQAVQGTVATVMYTGNIDFIESTWSASGTVSGKSTAGIRCTGIKQLLQDADVTLPLYQDTTADVPISHVLNQVVAPALGYDYWILEESGSSLGNNTYLGVASNLNSLETGETTIEYYGDTEGTKKGYDVISEMTDTEQGYFWIDRAGKGRFINRHHRWSTATNAGTVSTTGGDYKPKDADYGYGRHMATSVRVKLNPRNVGGGGETLWELDKEITIPAGDTITFDVVLRKSNGQFTGSGSLDIGTETYSSGSAVASVDPKGGKAVVTVVNSGNSDAVLSVLTLEGTSITNQNQMYVSVTDQDAIDEYGKRNELDFDLIGVTDYAIGDGLANYILARFRQPFGDVASLHYERASDGAANSHMIDWEVNTRLAVNLEGKNHSGAYWIQGEQHHVSSGKHTTTFMLEPADANGMWTLGVAGLSELALSTVIGF